MKTLNDVSLVDPTDDDLTTMVRAGLRGVAVGILSMGWTVQVDGQWFIVSVERSCRWQPRETSDE